MSATKKTGSRGSKRRTTTKRTTAHSKTKKDSKVYIPAYKTISLCLGVIAVCMILLLVSTLSKNSAKTENPEEASITERFEEDSKKQETEKLASPEIKLDDKKSGTKTPQKKEEQKSKQESVKTEETKKEAPKKETTTKVEEKKAGAKTDRTKKGSCCKIF